MIGMRDWKNSCEYTGTMDCIFTKTARVCNFVSD